MAKVEVCLCLVLLMAVGSNAIFGWGSQEEETIVTATEGEPVRQECLALAQQGRCEFYACLERRLTCGPTGYIAGEAIGSCNTSNNLRANFTPAGQAFIQNSRMCVLTSLIHSYQQDSINCQQFSQQARANITRCAIENDFCSVFPDNVRLFMRIQMQQPGDFSSSRAYQVLNDMSALMTHCGSWNILGSVVGQSFSNMAQNIGSAITSLFSST